MDQYLMVSLIVLCIFVLKKVVPLKKKISTLGSDDMKKTDIITSEIFHSLRYENYLTSKK